MKSNSLDEMLLLFKLAQNDQEFLTIYLSA
jgi:hypothetical protein